MSPMLIDLTQPLITWSSPRGDPSITLCNIAHMPVRAAQAADRMLEDIGRPQSSCPRCRFSNAAPVVASAAAGVLASGTPQVSPLSHGRRPSQRSWRVAARCPFDLSSFAGPVCATDNRHSATTTFRTDTHA